MDNYKENTNYNGKLHLICCLYNSFVVDVVNCSVKLQSNRLRVVQNSTKIERNRKMENSEQPKSKAKLPKCKVFEIPLKNLAIVGIRPNLAMQPYPFNAKIFMGFLALGCAIYCTCVYTIYDAKSFAEYTQSIYVCSLLALIVLILLAIIPNAEKMFELIDACDQLVNTSQLRHSPIIPKNIF